MRERRITAKISENFNFLRLLKNPLVYFEDFFGLAKSGFVFYRLKSGEKFKIRQKTCDRGIIKEVFFYKCYNPEGMEIGADDIVFDVGAQIGIFSVYASKRAKNGKVFSFEPVAENFKGLEENKELNECANLSINNLAVAKDSGRRKMNFSGDNSGGHSLAGPGQEGSGLIEINSISLPEFMMENKIEKIDFFKIDCEGGEYEIFFNLPKDVLLKIKKISMEYHDLDAERNGEKMKEFLIANGFKVSSTVGKFTMIYAQR